MYLQAQGLRGIDAHRTLQLRPNAPRELVVEVYWTLVSRSRQADLRARHRDELSAAYALLMDDERRSRQEGRRADVARDGGHYAALCIDDSADAGIIDAAYSFLVRNRQRMKRSERHAVREAYRVLANPQLRAQYDATRAHVSAAAPVVSERAPAGDGDVRTRAARAAPPRGGSFGRAARVQPRDLADARLLGLREAAVASLPEPPASRAPSYVLNGDALAEVVFVAGPQAGLRMPLDGGALTLGGSAGDTVLLDTLAPADGFHLWQQGDRFMLREDGGARVLVCGRTLALRLIVLDDGDEIAIGVHRMRFRRIPPG